MILTVVIVCGLWLTAALVWVGDVIGRNVDDALGDSSKRQRAMGPW